MCSFLLLSNLIYSIIIFIEYGVWQIKFTRGAGWKDISGKRCDTLQIINCDPYIKILVDDQEVFRTKTQWHQNLVNFDETYISPRMKKDSNIVIEMWDDDSTVGDWGTADDLMSRWGNGTVDLFMRYNRLAGHKYYGKYQNKVEYLSSWMDELPADVA